MVTDKILFSLLGAHATSLLAYKITFSYNQHLVIFLFNSLTILNVAVVQKFFFGSSRYICWLCVRVALLYMKACIFHQAFGVPH